MDSLQIDDYKASQDNKIMNGEVITPTYFVNNILDLLPKNIFKNPKLKWLDPCVGSGNFSVVLYERLFKHLKTEKKELIKRNYILENMLYMIEKNPEHIPRLSMIFGENSNIMNGDFLEMKAMKFDIIVGNPPFNTNGVIKVPTNKGVSKKKDGKTIWQDFIITSINNLNKGGYLAMIIPALWLKKGHYIQEFIKRNGEILKLHGMTNTETNKIFKGYAQTPTSYFLFKKGSPYSLQTWDSIHGEYADFPPTYSIPLKYPSIILKLLKFTERVGNINVIKTSMRPGYKGLDVSIQPGENNQFINVSTCVLNKLKPELVINYSNIPCVFNNVPKLILAHKTYGFPYYDASGKYGISNRDNYVITGYTERNFKRLRDFLSSKLALLVFETTRYRMSYLEKNAFEYIPDITKLEDFPELITEKAIADYFSFDELERKGIENIISKKYLIVC